MGQASGTGEYIDWLVKKSKDRIADAEFSLLHQGIIELEDFDIGVNPHQMQVGEKLAYKKLLGLFHLKDWTENSVYRQLTDEGAVQVQAIFEDSLDTFVDQTLAKVAADYKLGGQAAVSMDDYILNVARELRFVHPLFRGGEKHYPEEEYLTALNHEVLLKVFRFPESILAAFYVVGKGIEERKLEILAGEDPHRLGCDLRYKR